MPTFDIDPYKKDETLRTLHWEFGSMLARRGHVSKEDSEAVSLLGAKCLQAVDNGHSCLSLKDWSILPAEEIPERMSDYSPLELENWHKLITRIPNIVSKDEKAFTPLFFDKDNELLYLRKYYDAEKRIAKFVLDRLEKKTKVNLDDNLKRDIHESSRLFENCFENDMQQQAIAMALTHDFSILTGGPGTGKTTTLAAFLVLALKKTPSLNIALAAPTGKAAVQMKDSLFHLHTLNTLYNHIDYQILLL